MSDLRLYSVNWQDGMLLTGKHFKDQEKYFENLAKWHQRATVDNFGLVKKSTEGNTALSMNASMSGNRMTIEITRCQAITPDGSYIEINESLGTIVRGEAEIEENRVMVYIGIDPEIKTAVGDAEPSEAVPRVPYNINNYKVFIGQTPNLPEGLYIPIAQLSINGTEISPAPDYFPPCMTLNAEDRLAQKATDYRNRLENLLALSTRAYMAVTTSGALEGASTNLQIAFKDTMYHLVYHFASTLDEFIVGKNAPHPINMVIQFKKLFRVISSLLNLSPGLKDYLNEKYFTREHKMEIGKFMAAVDAFLLAEYEHKNIGSHVAMIDSNLGALRGMLAFLAQTKAEQLGDQAMATEMLTYSGKTYKNIDYSASRLEQVGELSYLVVDIAEPLPVGDAVILVTKDLYSEAEWRSMQVRLGVNEARGLGETDPVDVDTTSYGNKVALHPRDMLSSSSVRQLTLIFRSGSDMNRLADVGKMDLIVYTI